MADKPRKPIATNKRDEITLQTSDTTGQPIDPDHLPPVGTVIHVHKHLTNGGDALWLEVVGQEWHLKDDIEDSKGNPKFPSFNITIQTRRLKT